MGTRNLICIFYKGSFVVAQYCQWDGYPEGKGQGMKILNFLLSSANIEHLKNGLQHIITLNHDSRQQLEHGVRQDQEAWQTNMSFSKGPCKCVKCDIEGFYPSLSRDTGASILKIITEATAEKPVPVELRLGFANDPNCEWAYVVDLDDCVFEVYAEAESKNENPTNRFINIGDLNDTVPSLIKSFPFSDLPITEREFITALNTEFK
ncbi:uncharacterized protein Z518_11289 [Rhinocladiella mackenziei CBS 650.93]|uniref:Uncharacterized protein n=1 Tax=Rhinocladiella mackenziei CBS 650.93 TaxID=1442369 RepID=A0A0D2I8L6_9EURO|nr:uncharacterized protein Z518_11289 [Rhinocladiella mackenziei CBS 650.93]KIW99550.1 hypothetical protein Z518_11289 [Rhinocladiella mackenziei CBS 650.93]